MANIRSEKRTETVIYSVNIANFMVVFKFMYNFSFISIYTLFIYFVILIIKLIQQFQSWSTDGVPPCMEQAADPSISVKIRDFHKTLTKSRPWHPTLGYKVLKAAPL